MFTSFETAFGASAYYGLLVIVCGVVIVAGATLLPSLLLRCRRRGRRPLP
jgi:Flp pilus assembly protein TadB